MKPLRQVKPIVIRLILYVFLAVQMVSTAYGAERILRADIRHRPPEMIVDGKITSGPLKEILEDAAKQLLEEKQ